MLPPDEERRNCPSTPPSRPEKLRLGQAFTCAMILAIGVAIVLGSATQCGDNTLPSTCWGPHGKFIAFPKLTALNCLWVPSVQSSIKLDTTGKKLACGWQTAYLGPKQSIFEAPSCKAQLHRELYVHEGGYRGMISYIIECPSDSGFRSCGAIWELDFREDRDE